MKLIIKEAYKTLARQMFCIHDWQWSGLHGRTYETVVHERTCLKCGKVKEVRNEN